MPQNPNHACATKAKAGFVFDCEVLRAGEVIDAERGTCNLMPAEGRNHIAQALFRKVPLASDWYFGVYESNVIPTDDIKASNISANLGESTAYAPAARPAFVAGEPVAGVLDNTASRAEMTFTTAKRIYGAFIASVPAKGSTSGVVISAVRFDTPKDVTVGDTLRLTGAFQFVSA